MQPEISRRCLSCGASVHTGAMFCPECGQPQAERAPEPTTVIAESPRELSAVETPAAEVTAVSESPDIAAAPAVELVETQPESEPAPSAEMPITVIVPAERQKGGAARETLHRASAAARGAIGDNVKRVEKIRHVSTVVLEEASYDASLRFVLVALALFLLVAVLLFVSKVMG